jgi:hypothetical protein
MHRADISFAAIFSQAAGLFPSLDLAAASNIFALSLPDQHTGLLHKKCI